MMTARRSALLLVLALSVLVSLTACERSAPTESEVSFARAANPADLEPAGSANAQGVEFFPLELGNRWHYTRTVSIQAIEGGIPQPPEIHVGSMTTELTEMETLFGREYMVEERHILVPSLFDDAREWIRYRQDHSGLYEADVSILMPPGTSPAALSAGSSPVAPVPAFVAARAGEPGYLEAWQSLWERHERIRSLARGAVSATRSAPGRPGKVLSGEIIRLDYPLHSGASWTVREDPLFTSTVEGRDVLDTAAGKSPAWRIRMDSPLFGLNDVGRLWYGRRGMIRLFVHGEVEIRDPEGNPVGVLILESDDLLDALDLQGPRGGASAGPPRPGEAVAGT